MTDINFYAVMDERIVQPSVNYGVDKGPSSVSCVNFTAVSATSSSMSFNCLSPSLNTWVSRDLELSAEYMLKFTVTLTQGTAAAATANVPVIIPGKEVSQCAFPIQSMMSTATANINNCTSTINIGDILPALLMLNDNKKYRMSQMCPSTVDKCLSYDDCKQFTNNPLAGYQNSIDHDFQNNGSFAVDFINPADGNPLSGTSTYVDPLNGGTINYVNGVPILSNNNSGTLLKTYTVILRFRSTERLLLSPFLHSSDDAIGLFGISQIQLLFNFSQANIARVLRYAVSGYTGSTNVTDKAISDISLYGNGFYNARVSILYLSPSLDIDIPITNSVDYLEYARYLSSYSTVLNAGGKEQITSQSIVLNCVPEYLIVWGVPTEFEMNSVKYPSSSGRFGNAFLPIESFSLNFNNVSGILSSHTREMLYNITQKYTNLDYNQWLGIATAEFGDPNVNRTFCSRPQDILLCGSCLVLKPGRDFALSVATAPGTIGSFICQYNVTFANRSAAKINGLTLYTMVVNSGFFESSAGSSKIIRSVLTENIVLSAPSLENNITSGDLQRYIGGSLFSKNLHNAFSKVKGFLSNKDNRENMKKLARNAADMAGERGKVAHNYINDAENMGFGAAMGGPNGAGRASGAASGRRANARNLL